ncbi:mesoderm induction early response protein 1-like [Episyrphus balteatus]|uniref:mesoderm induction early response protein 1-like n=1 Tax=Episyrphus balteatus TaxID=286459 RepID=UPI002485E1B1|nr:mesoderm induction early response protein 1-like [Episyrphus balteatus]
MDTKKSNKQTKIVRKTTNTTIHASATSLLDSYWQDCQQQPPSPASSSTSQTTGDTTFEPSIDMMVNDFDDEQTLTEEEALAELESQDPADEIETLQKESEMPLEKLLEHYRQHVQEDYQQQQQQQQRRHKRKKSTKKHKQMRSKQQQQKLKQSTNTEVCSSSSSSSKNTSTTVPPTTIDEVIVIEESEDEVEILKTEQTDTDVGEDESSSIHENEAETNADEDDGDDEEEAEFDDSSIDNDPADAFNLPSEHTKLTALALLYPDKYTNIQDKMDDEFSDEDDDDDDYVKKTIMVGAAYQATIPIGLSKYGDVLPYENEDKLIWEPSQVSEQEVEDYLIRVKELKSSPNLLTQDDDIPSSSASVTSESDQGLGCSTVKDDEQALHLLVLCGYNFKEALRRKRLNAVPLTGSMSLWSEEECRNFEEGIQKFGKDFRKIRQTQVRTRSIRELVQFYYLWKKTERRDKDFVDSDTIDHMDTYLDYDERDTASNGGSKHTLSCLLSSDIYLTNQEPPSKKHHHHNFSIMNETNRSSGGHSNFYSSSKKSSSNKKSHRRRSSSLLSGTKSKYHHNNDISSSLFRKKNSSTSSPSASTGKTCRNSCSNSTSSAMNANSSSSTNNSIGNHINKK